jgi:hypothetical protein
MIVLLPLLGCPAPVCKDAGCESTPVETDTDTDSDADTDADGDTDTDTDTDVDSARATEWLTVDATWTADGVFEEGHLGTEYFPRLATGFAPEDSLCRDVGTWTPDATIVEPCPDCVYGYPIIVEGSTATGPFCADFGLEGGEWDGDTHMVFAPATVYDYETYTFIIVPNIWTYDPVGYEWINLTEGAYIDLTETTLSIRAVYGYGYYYP